MKLSIKLLAVFSLLSVVLGNLDTAFAGNDSIGWKDIAVGGGVSLAIKKDGTLWAWGESNRSGVFGNGQKGTENPMIPVQVSGLKDVRLIAAGSHHALAVDKGGSVWAWGRNSEGQIGDGTKTVIKPGQGSQVVEDNDRVTPVKVRGIDNVVLVAGNWSKSFAVTSDGSLWNWGKSPSKLDGFFDIVSISTGYGNNLIATRKDGTVWTLDQGKAVQIEGLNDVLAVAAASRDSYALKKDGSVWVFGSNGAGKIAGETVNKKSNPKLVEGITDVVSIQATAGGPLYLKRDGTVWASGQNLGGQLGIGSYEDSNVPVQVKGLHKIIKIAAHGTGFRSMALREDGTLFSWGGGYTGDGTQWYRTEPVWIKSNENEDFVDNLISVKIDEKVLEFEQLPILVDGTTLVPMRKIFESLGAEIEWHAETSTVTAHKGQTTIQLTIDSDSAIINGELTKLDAPPIIKNGVTLVPVRFISESLGTKVEWKETTKTVQITSN
ncbi:stalk domain-containing protein [Paenibacillus naphthalenovorans]|uniref:stalk domain-containing protein n=2 Tax=Paenibacillus naphthalenovorans TaxID=162209 RepID=UPI003D2C47C5